MGQRLLRALLCVMAFALVATGQQSPAHAAGPAWWNASYSHRLAINVYANDSITSGYSLDVVFNHAQMVSQKSSMASGDDVRIAYWNGTTWTELDRVLAYGSNWNSATTDVVFKAPMAMSANSNSDAFYLYFGNGTASSPPANANNVYALWDDFSGATLDTTKWIQHQVTGSFTVAPSAGRLVVSGTTDATNATAEIGVRTNGNYSNGYQTEASVAFTPPTANWKSRLGSQLYLQSNSYDAKVATYSGSTIIYGDSTFDGTGPINARVRTTNSLDGITNHYEAGAARATKGGGAVMAANFTFSPNVSGIAVNAAFDDIIIRKFVTYEPTVSIEQSTDIPFTTDVAALLSFSIAPRSSTCNGVTPTSGVTTTANSIDFGRINSITPALAAQDLTVSTNARVGFVIGAKSVGALSTGLRPLPDINVPNSSPATFPGGAGFGYTASLLPRFNNAFAGFDATSREIASASTPATSTSCIAYRVQADASTSPGVYSTTVVYTAVPAF